MTQSRELFAVLSDPPLSSRAKEPREGRKKERKRGGPERASENSQSWSFDVEDRPRRDAFTYLTCNNLEKVLTMV